MTSSNDAPTGAQLEFLRRAEMAVGGALEALNRVFEEDVAAFREMVDASGLELLPEQEPLEMPR